jgi:hypothetical protein
MMLAQECLASSLGLSLFMGRPADEIQPYLDHREELPAHWWLPAKRRSREASAHLDSEVYNPIDILRYWADKDLGADILEVDAGVLLVER